MNTPNHPTSWGEPHDRRSHHAPRTMTHTPPGDADALVGPRERSALNAAAIFRACANSAARDGAWCQELEAARAADNKAAYAVTVARVKDRSDTALALRLRRMVQP